MDWKAIIHEMNDKIDSLLDKKNIEAAKGNKIVAGRCSKDAKRMQDAVNVIRKYFI